jgi:hypothetical protein
MVNDYSGVSGPPYFDTHGYDSTSTGSTTS